MSVAIPCALVTIPRKVLNAYAAAVRAGQTGNFVIHLRGGEVLGLTFEQKESYSDTDRRDLIELPRRWTSGDVLG